MMSNCLYFQLFICKCFELQWHYNSFFELICRFMFVCIMYRKLFFEINKLNNNSFVVHVLKIKLVYVFEVLIIH